MSKTCPVPRQKFNQRGGYNLRPLDNLITLINTKDIDLIYWDFPEIIESVFIFPKAIGLNKSLRKSTDAQLCCLLAGNLGYFYTAKDKSAPNLFFKYHDSSKTTFNYEDYLALKWAANYLIPRHELEKVNSSGKGLIKLAKHFGVTAKMMKFRLKLYERGLDMDPDQEFICL